MAEFVFAGGTLPTKSTLNALPGGADVAKWWRSVDYMAMRTALIEIRAAILAGTLAGLTPQATRPAVAAATANFFWLKDDGTLYWFDGVFDATVLPGDTGFMVVATLDDLPELTDEPIGLRAWVQDIHRWATADAPFWYLDEFEEP